MIRLTDREREVVELIGEGLRYAEIAARMRISIHTVRTYVYSIAARIGGKHSPRESLLLLHHDLVGAPGRGARKGD